MSLMLARYAKFLETTYEILQLNVSKKHVGHAFGKAAKTYNESAVVQSEILSRLLSKLSLLQPTSECVLDLGSGTGLAQDAIQKMYGRNAYIALDMAYPMLQWALSENNTVHLHQSICADMEMLPLKDNVVDTIFSASCLQWSNNIQATFQECFRTLNNEGILLFSTFGPGTLSELNHSFNQVDDHPHVKTFTDMHDLGDILLAVGFASPVMESEVITVEYTDPWQLFRDLKATGATNHLQDRSKGLLGKQRLNSVLEEYKKFRLTNGKYPASYEVIYGHGRKLVSTGAHSEAEEWQPISFKR